MERRTKVALFFLSVFTAGFVSFPLLSSAQAETKSLPTLLIKGEVVSVETGDASGTLVKVKDRYGFETPIFAGPETKVTKGQSGGTLADVVSGAEVQIEYHFDVNTAKRHAVAVALSEAASGPETTTAEPVAAPQESAATEAPQAPPTPTVEPAPEAAAPLQETPPASGQNP